MAAFPTTVNPAFGGSVSVEPKVLVAPFGDGYSAIAQDGINAQLGVLAIKFSTLSAAEALEITDFCRDHNGTTSFTFTPPFLSSGNYIAKKWTRAYPGLRNQTVVVEMFEVP